VLLGKDFRAWSANKMGEVIFVVVWRLVWFATKSCGLGEDFFLFLRSTVKTEIQLFSGVCFDCPARRVVGAENIFCLGSRQNSNKLFSGVCFDCRRKLLLGKKRRPALGLDKIRINFFSDIWHWLTQRRWVGEFCFFSCLDDEKMRQYLFVS